MHNLKGKKVVLGVTGGVAAYKACLIARNLMNAGAEVKTVMTPAATEFVAPLTFSALTGNEVVVEIFPADQGHGVSLKTWHIDLGLWADLMIIAPATVNTVAKIASGFADNALTTLALALRCPMIVAPAADMDMYMNPASRENITTLERRGIFIVEGEEGYLASGLKGPGRMADPGKITDAAALVLSGLKKDLGGKKILVTAGPTYEDIDPVRFIGNRSSGKMGYAIAKAAFLRGAEVTLVSGPSAQNAYQEIPVTNVRSAAEMKEAVEKLLPENDILIMSAAVADFRASKKYPEKIKKEEKPSVIELEPTDDILKSLEKEGKIIAGFALETEDELKNAKGKLDSKGMDMIVLNSLKEEGAGFEFDTNKITVIKKDGKINSYPLTDKFQTANFILTELNDLTEN